jgi:hypothetical protein
MNRDFSGPVSFGKVLNDSIQKPVQIRFNEKNDLWTPDHFFEKVRFLLHEAMLMFAPDKQEGIII